MSSETNTSGSSPSRLHTASIVQLAFSLLGIVAVWSTAATLALIGLIERFNPSPGSPGYMPFLLLSASVALVGILLLPSAGYALLRLLGRAADKSVRLGGRLIPLSLVVILPIVLLLGRWVSDRQDINWLLLPPIHLLAIGLPVLFLTFLGLRGIRLGSPQRVWGVVAAGSCLGPILIFAAEALAVSAFMVLALIWLSTRPELMSELTLLVERLEGAPYSPQIIQQIIAPYLARPAVVLSVLAFGALVVPLIEEVIKPVGVWLLAGYQLSPATGFAMGVLSGAGYALVESLGLANTGEGWIELVLARMGTAGVHILTAGMFGWALAQAWQEGRYLRLGVIYLLNVALHGVWNAVSLSTITTTLPLLEGANSNLAPLARLADFATYILAGLALLAVIVIWVVNRRIALSEEEAPAARGVV